MSGMTSVIDSSVVLAVIRGEAGAQKGFRLSQGAVMSTVNIAEVVTKCIEWRYPEEAALELIQSCGIQSIELDDKLAVLTGQLRRGMPKGMLSLGDRACLATAIELKGTVITADRIWAELDLPCKVDLIR